MRDIVLTVRAIFLQDTTKLKDFLMAAKELKQKEGKMVLCSLADYVKEIFEISGFDSMIPISDTVEFGIKQLG